MAKDKMFKKAMEVKYCQEFGTNQNRGSNVTNITDKTAKYLRLGYTQSPRKVEMAAAGAKITAKRGGVQAYDPYLHLAGIPLGQRQLTPYTVSGTNTVCEGDDLHFVNNAAMQQMWDDIRRTCVVGLDIAHETLEKRLGKEVTPETIAYYLDVVNHALPGAAIVQEHMVETHPALVDDCYLKVFTGDDELKDELPRQYVIDIDKEFPANQAKQIKASIGLPGCLADRCLDLLCLVCWELLVDVYYILAWKFVFQFIITSEYFQIAVIYECWVCFDHVFLNNCCSRKCVVDHIKIVCDCFRCDFLAESLFECLVCNVKTDNACSSDIIPHLLHCCIVYEVKIVAFADSVCTGDCVWGELSLAEWDTCKVEVWIVCLNAASLCGDLCASCCHFNLSWGLGITESKVFSMLVSDGAATVLVCTKFLTVHYFHCFLKHLFFCHKYHLLSSLAGIRILF